MSKVKSSIIDDIYKAKESIDNQKTNERVAFVASHDFINGNELNTLIELFSNLKNRGFTHLYLTQEMPTNKGN